MGLGPFLLVGVVAQKRLLALRFVAVAIVVVVVALVMAFVAIRWSLWPPVLVAVGTKFLCLLDLIRPFGHVKGEELLLSHRDIPGAQLVHCWVTDVIADDILPRMIEPIESCGQQPENIIHGR